LQAFKPNYLFRCPEFVLYSLADDLDALLINRSAIKAEFKTANSKQLQAMYTYECVIVNAYMEVSKEIFKINNLDKSYSFKLQQVDALNRSVSASNDLF
jgi:multidrug efflux system outer membrane protein